MMMISRNRPGVNQCDECRLPFRPVFSWSVTENADGTGWQIVSTIHFCAACLLKFGQQLAELPPFLEQMRYELSEVQIWPPPKARYADIMAAYRERFPDRAPDASLPDPNAPVPPSVPEVRKMLRNELNEVAHEFAPALENTNAMSRDELVEALVQHFEAPAKVAVRK